MRKELNAESHGGISALMFKIALLKEQPEGASTNGYINKMMYKHSIKYLLVNFQERNLHVRRTLRTLH